MFPRVAYVSKELLTTNLGVRSSNLFGRAIFFNDLAPISRSLLPKILDWEAYGKRCLACHDEHGRSQASCYNAHLLCYAYSPKSVGVIHLDRLSRCG